MKFIVCGRGPVGLECLSALVESEAELEKVYLLAGRFEEGERPDSLPEFCRKRDLESELLNEPEALVSRVSGGVYESMLLGIDFPLPPLFRAAQQASLPAAALHLSLLPAHPGEDAAARAILRGDHKTGVSLVCSLKRKPAPFVADQEEEWIKKEDTSTSLYRRLAALSRRLLENNLPRLKTLDPLAFPLSEPLALDQWEPALEPEAGRIDWHRTAWEIYNQVRALTRPYPGAFSGFLGEKMTIWRAEPDDSNIGLLHPGEIEVEEDRLLAGTRSGALRIEEAQWQGRIMTGRELARALKPYWQEKFSSP